jgi:hypothetical protein
VDITWLSMRRFWPFCSYSGQNDQVPGRDASHSAGIMPKAVGDGSRHPLRGLMLSGASAVEIKTPVSYLGATMTVYVIHAQGI